MFHASFSPDKQWLLLHAGFHPRSEYLRFLCINVPENELIRGTRKRPRERAFNGPNDPGNSRNVCITVMAQSARGEKKWLGREKRKEKKKKEYRSGGANNRLGPLSGLLGPGSRCALSGFPGAVGERANSIHLGLGTIPRNALRGEPSRITKRLQLLERKESQNRRTFFTPV